MDVVSSGPLRVASLVWQSRTGAWTLTVIVKATYALTPEESRLAERQDDVDAADQHWDDDERGSLRVASEVVPFKPRADVLVVGHAYAPRGQPASSLIARLAVGDVDKSIEVLADRTLSPDGQLHEGPRFTRMPLRWERAAGGPGTANPVGVRVDAAPDLRGSIPLPNLRPPGAAQQPRSRPSALGYGPDSGQRIEPIGYGPISPRWPGRVAHLPKIAGGQPYPVRFQQPLPEGLDPSYFNAAPPDQQVDALPPSPRLLLEHLHPEHARLVTRLSDVQPRAVVERMNAYGDQVPLRADTLVIDTDRGVCTLVWRGQVALDHPTQPGRVVISSNAAAPARAPEVTRAPPPSGPRQQPTVEASALAALKPVLPFDGRAAPPPPAPPAPPAPPPLRVPAPVPIEPVAPPPVVGALPPPPIEPVAPPLRVPPVGADVRPIGLSIGQRAIDLPRSPAPPVEPIAPAPAREEEVAARELIQLAWFDAEAMHGVRRKPTWRKILDEIQDAPPDLEAEDSAIARNPAEVEDRRDVSAILARADAIEPEALPEALAAGARADGAFVPRLLLITGEITFPFDELEVLRATVTTVSPLAAGDEGLKSAVDAAREFLRAPELRSAPAVAEGLTTNVREAFTKARSAVPAGYLDAQIERVLLEQRSYQRRRVFGDAHLRGLMPAREGQPPAPAYLPEAAATKLPLFRRFRARLIVELNLPIDQYEPHPAALRVAAIARLAPGIITR